MSKSEKQNIKLDKVDDKTAYENLLIKYAELENQIAEITQTNNNLLDVINNQDVKIADLEKQIVEILDAKCTSCTELGGMQLKINRLEQQIEKMKNCYNCANYYTKACTGCEDYCNWELEE